MSCLQKQFHDEKLHLKTLENTAFLLQFLDEDIIFQKYFTGAWAWAGAGAGAKVGEGEGEEGEGEEEGEKKGEEERKGEGASCFDSWDLMAG